MRDRPVHERTCKAVARQNLFVLYYYEKWRDPNVMYASIFAWSSKNVPLITFRYCTTNNFSVNKIYDINSNIHFTSRLAGSDSSSIG